MPRPPSELLSARRRDIGRRIRTFRQSRGLTQLDLANILQVVQSHVSNIERGARSVTIQQVTKLSKAFRISTDEILNDTKKVPERRSLKSGRLLRRLQRIEELPVAQQRAVLKILDGLLDKHDNGRSRKHR